MAKTLSLFIIGLAFFTAVSAQPIEWFQNRKISSYNFGRFLSMSGNDVVVSGAVESHRRDPDTLNWGGYVSKYSDSGKIIWEKRFYAGLQAFAPTNTTDKKGNIYISVGSFLSKYTPEGNLLFKKLIGPSAYLEAICIDSKNNILVKGSISSDSLFNGVKISGEGFIAKYSEDGTFLWVKDFFFYPTLEKASYLILDDSDNIYTAGAFFGTVQFEKSTTLTSVGSSDGYVAKYDSSAALLWVETLKGESAEAIHGISVNNIGEIFVSGYYGDYSLPSVSYLGNFSISVPEKSKSDIFLAKYSASGNCEWVRTASGNGIDFIRTITCDNAGNVFVAGHTTSSMLNFGSRSIPAGEFSGSTMFLAQYNSSGDLISAMGNKGGGGLSCDLVCSDKGDLYYTGAFGGNFTFGSASATSEGEMFLMKLNYDAGNKTGLTNEQLSRSDFSLIIYPNPSGDCFMLVVNNNRELPFRYTITDAMGKIIIEHTKLFLDNEGAQQIDLTKFPKGIYFAEISTGEQKTVRKLIRN